MAGRWARGSAAAFYAGGMNSVQLVLLALLFGAAAGVGVFALISFAVRAGRRARAAATAQVPEGVTQVLSAMDDAAIVVDRSLTIVAIAPAAAAFGLDTGGVVVDDELRDIGRHAPRSGGHERAQVRLRRPGMSAETHVAMARASMLSPRYCLLMLHDITEQLRVEEMRRDFVANTSHELKTPVGAVTLLAEAIESAADDPDQVRYFTTRLAFEAERLARLTSRILDLSRVQAAEELTEAVSVSVDEVVAASLEEHAVVASAAKIELVRGGQRGTTVVGDAQTLTEAVSNLIANAVAYSTAGAHVGVGVRVVDGVVEIAVTDQGTGIAEADQQRIFERFYRADQARSRRTGGTGLGLAIVKHAVQRHDGEVRVWSQPGRGSTFTIRIPEGGASVASQNRNDSQ